MRGRIIDFSVGMNGKQRVSFELDGDFRETYNALKDRDVSVEVKKYREKRSLDANAYAWTLIDKLALATNLTPIDVYRNSIRKIAGVSDVTCVQDKAVKRLCEGWERNGAGWQAETFPSKVEGCTNVTLYYGSSTYNTAQMARLIDFIIEDCKEYGIETDAPEQIARYKEEWGRA